MAATALVPATGIVMLVSADAAHARGEGNGNGGGGDRGNSGGGGERGNGGKSSEARGGDATVRGGGRPEWAGGREQSASRGNGRSESVRGGGDPISNFIRGLTGQDKRAAREQARSAARTQGGAARQASTERAPEVSIAPAARPDRATDLHPSELGNMNAALNADMNAILAHIRNGNTSGPVGQMAALAVASAAAADADEILSSPDAEAYRDLQTVLEQAGYGSLQEYLDVRETAPNTAIEDALAEVTTLDEVRYEEYLAARDAQADLLAAQESILAFWNKNPDAAPEIDDQTEQPLLDALMSRFEGYEPEISEAITEGAARAVPDVEDEDEATLCAEAEGCEAPETAGEELVAAD
jgi:hypothetical protein